MTDQLLLKTIGNELLSDPVLVNETNVRIDQYSSDCRDQFFDLYVNALKRGDWFSSNCIGVSAEERTNYFIDHVVSSQNALPIVFQVDGEIIGATCLYLTEPSIVLIDETQVDPIKGRRRGAMTAYFRKLIPIGKRLDVNFETEFLLTEGSRVLRDVLINELGMLTTGIRIGCYSTFDGSRLESVLTACTPCDQFQQALATLSMSAHAVASFSNTLKSSGACSCPDFRVEKTNEMTFPMDDHDSVLKAIMDGFAPSSVDPLRKTLRLTEAKIGSRSRPLSFLVNEKNNASQILNFISQQTLRLS
jgi:hypothetical protein